jgi:flavin reductase (DIM6/NTAB) family NADH-FMN oxidoreductase RutF
MSVDPRSFRKAAACFASGVTVVTARHPATKAPAGVTVSAFSSLSLDPPLVLFCLAKRTVCLETFGACGHFGVNILSECQRDLAIRFANRSEEKWTGVTVESGVSGVPLLPGCLATLECVRLAVHDGGDHHIFVGEVERLAVSEGGAPLLYFRGSYQGAAPVF